MGGCGDDPPVTRSFMRLLTLLLLVFSGAVQAAEPELLDPEQAFRFAARVAGPDALEVRYRIAPGY